MVTNIEAPKNITAEVGKTLGEVKLPDGFSWDDGPATIISGMGGEVFTVSYGNVRYIPIKINYIY